VAHASHRGEIIGEIVPGGHVAVAGATAHCATARCTISLGHNVRLAEVRVAPEVRKVIPAHGRGMGSAVVSSGATWSIRVQTQMGLRTQNGQRPIDGSTER